MNHNLEVKQSIEINASPATIWKALTTPSIIAKYLHGTNTITDWKQGSEIWFEGEYEGQHYKDGGIIKNFDPPHTLSYSYWTSFSGLENKEENRSLVNYYIHSEDNITKLTWHQVGFANETNRQHSEDGMPAFLSNIKSIVEQL